MASTRAMKLPSMLLRALVQLASIERLRGGPGRAFYLRRLLQESGKLLATEQTNDMHALANTAQASAKSVLRSLEEQVLRIVPPLFRLWQVLASTCWQIGK